MAKKTNQLKLGAMISYLQMGLSVLVGVLYTPIMIRLLGQSEYGLYNTTASTISMLSILRLGFNNSYIRYFSKYRKSKDTFSIYKLNGVFLVLFSIIGIICFACGMYLTNHLEIVFSNGLTDEEYSLAKILMILLTINLSISFPMSVFSSIISAHERFVFLKGLEVIKTLVGPMITLPLLLMGYGSVAMVSVTLSVSVFVDIIFIFYVIVRLKNKFLFSIPEKGLIKDIVAYTSFIAIELIVDQINWNIDKVLLARFKGTSAVAVYSVGYSLYTYYQTFSSSVSGVFTTRIHKIVNEAETKAVQRKELTDIFTRVGRIQFLILALLSTGILFFGEYFITRIWAGFEYSDSYKVAMLLVFPSTIALIQNLGIEIQRAQYKHQFRSIVYMFMAAINLFMSIILCQIYGAIGSALGTSISLLVANGLIMNIYYHKRCNIDIISFWKSILGLSRGLVVPVLCGIGLKYLFPVNSIIVFCVEILVYSLLYACSMWIVGMNHYEKSLITQAFVKGMKRNCN